jgi:hypothetical protein
MPSAVLPAIGKDITSKGVDLAIPSLRILRDDELGIWVLDAATIEAVRSLLQRDQPETILECGSGVSAEDDRRGPTLRSVRARSACDGARANHCVFGVDDDPEKVQGPAVGCVTEKVSCTIVSASTEPRAKNAPKFCSAPTPKMIEGSQRAAV